MRVHCGLFVGKDVFEGKTPLKSVPECRPLEKQIRAYGTPIEASAEKTSESVVLAVRKYPKVKKKLWYCKPVVSSFS